MSYLLLRKSFSWSSSGMAYHNRSGMYFWPKCTQSDIKYFIQPYKHSSTPHSIRWSTSQHVQPTVSPSQTKRQLMTKLWICLILRWYTSKLASMYVSVWYQLHLLTLWYRAMLSRVISVCHVASNTDAYFAVMGHWIEESRPGGWEIQSALLGFVRVNCT